MVSMSFTLKVALTISALVVTLYAEDKPATPAPTPPTAVFTLTPIEQTELDKLKLEYENLNLKVQLNKSIIDAERAAYVEKTMKAHGDPKSTYFDADLMMWRPVPPTPAPTPAPAPTAPHKEK